MFAPVDTVRVERVHRLPPLLGRAGATVPRAARYPCVAGTVLGCRRCVAATPRRYPAAERRAADPSEGEAKGACVL